MRSEHGPGVAFDDGRLADFKLLLPLGPAVRALVVDVPDWSFVPHLAPEVGRLDLLGGADGDSLRYAAWAGLNAPGRVRRLADPEGTYDLVLSNRTSASQYLRPTGVLCHFWGPGAAADTEGLVRIGCWRADPGWPRFHTLIPDTPGARRAETPHLGLAGRRRGSWLRALASLVRRSDSVSRGGIALYCQRASAGAEVTSRLAVSSLDSRLLQEEGGTLSPSPVHVARRAHATSATAHGVLSPPWLLTSDETKPDAPILLFALRRDARPCRLIKAARLPGKTDLQAEAAQIARIDRCIGVAAQRLVRPTASACVDGRWALGYRFEPTWPFQGPFWYLRGRAGFCDAMTNWLGMIADATRRQADQEQIESVHLAPVRRLLERHILPGDLQHEAERTFEDLIRLAPSVPLILEHGDLGVHNTRLTRADGRDFRVLGWATSTFDGIPLGDLGCLLCSARAPAALASRCLSDYLIRARLPGGAAPSLWLSYLARRWEEHDRIRTLVPGESGSGGGILLPIHRRMRAYLRRLRRA